MTPFVGFLFFLSFFLFFIFYVKYLRENDNYGDATVISSGLYALCYTKRIDFEV
jgi:hypothetical protein